MPQIDTELGLLKSTKNAGAGNQEPLTPLSVAKLLAHVFLFNVTIIFSSAPRYSFHLLI